MDLTPFDYSGKTISVITKDDGSVWFSANEVCRTLGLANPRDAIRNHIRPQQKDVVNGDTLGGRQKMTIINEGGLYRLTLRSKKKCAIKFQDWVTDHVLPSIRETGSYSVNNLLPQTYKEALQHLLQEVEKNERLSTQNQELEAENTELKPKAIAYNKVSESQGLTCLSDGAKILNVNPHWFTRTLRHDEYLFYRRGKLVPYQKFIDEGLFETKLVMARDGSNHSYRQTFITPKGINFFGAIYNPPPEKISGGNQQRLFS